ncbi:MAG: LytTR family DNA-binding domain-containing protein [Saprospiraceae bacterium]
MNQSYISTHALDRDYLIRFAFERIRQLEAEIKRLKQPLPSTEKFVWVYQSKKLVKILLTDVLYIRSESNYSRLFLKCGTQYFMSRTLKSWANELSGDTFLRCHRSFLVNKSEITEIKRNTNEIVMRNGEIIPTSRRHQKKDVDAIVMNDHFQAISFSLKPDCNVYTIKSKSMTHKELCNITG